MPYDPPKGVAPITVAQTAANAADAPSTTIEATPPSVTAPTSVPVMPDAVPAVQALLHGWRSPFVPAADRAVLLQLQAQMAARTPSGAISGEDVMIALVKRKTTQRAAIAGGGTALVLGLGYWFFVRK